MNKMQIGAPIPLFLTPSAHNLVLQKVICRQNNVGFSLLEAIIALLILSILAGSLFGFQTQLIKGIWRAHGLLQSIVLAKNAQADVEKDGLFDKKGNQKISSDGADITYSLNAIASNSSLQKIKNLKQEKITVTWPNNWTAQEYNLYSFRFHPSSDKGNA